MNSEGSRWHESIGKVATASADMEHELREVGIGLAGNQDVTGLIFEGQSTEWLIGNAIAMAKAWDSFHSTRRHYFDEVCSALSAAKRPNDLRNVVIHGRLRHQPLADECMPRPYGGEINGGTMYFCRSRYRRLVADHAFNIEDLDRLANDLRAKGAAARIAFEAAGRAILRDSVL